MYDDNINGSNITAADSITANISNYGRFTLKTKIPHVVDGLKTVHRRILTRVAKLEKMSKVSTMAGNVMKIHPHGDLSISEAITELTKPYTNIIPLIHGVGNVGEYGSGDGPAAPRYLDIIPHPFATEVFFNRTHKKALKYVPTETDEGLEELYLIPAIPMSLLINTMAMIIGFKTEIYPLNFKNLCVLTTKFIDIETGKSKDSLKSLNKYMIPDFPTPCLIRNSQELLKEYNKGNYDAALIIDGTLELHKNKIIIKTLAPGVNFSEMVYTKLCKILQRRDMKYISAVDNLTGKDTPDIEGHVEVTLKKGVSPFDVLNSLKNIIRFQSTKHPTRLYVTEEGLGLHCTPLQLLDIWYKARIKSIIAELKQKQSQLMKERRKAEALVIAHDHAKEIFNVFNTSEHWEKAVEILYRGLYSQLPRKTDPQNS